MQNFFYILILVFLSTSCNKSINPVVERNAIVDSTIISLEKTLFKIQIDSVFAKHKFNGNASVFQDSILIYEKQDGFENFQKRTRLNRNTVFAIGSLSKQFTAVMVLLQQEAGRLKTSDRVSKYLPEFRNKEYQNITISQLVSHSSGLNDFGDKLLFKSGTDFNYSNKGFLMLGKVIEKVSGKSYDHNAVELFQRVGMTHTFTPSVFDSGDFGSAHLGTSINPKQVENMPKRLANDDISVPAGGILSTIEDLNKWNLALFGGKILKPESLAEMTNKSSERPHYVLGKVGYGYGIMMNLQSPQAFFHTGYVKGSPSLNIFYPETKTSVIILSNIANEGLGKEGFFRPHAEIKKLADDIESAVEVSRKEMLKKVTNK